MLFTPGDLLSGRIQEEKKDGKNNWNKMERKAAVKLMSEGERSNYLAISKFCKRRLFLHSCLSQGHFLLRALCDGTDEPLSVFYCVWGWNRFLPLSANGVCYIRMKIIWARRSSSRYHVEVRQSCLLLMQWAQKDATPEFQEQASRRVNTSTNLQAFLIVTLY